MASWDPCPLYRAWTYPPNRVYDPRCWSEGNRMVSSQFCFTPYRPAVAGAFIRGATQRVFGGCPIAVPQCPAAGAVQAQGIVSQRADACATGRVWNGMCT